MAGFFGGEAMPIDPSLEQGVFLPEASAAMGGAFEAACREFHDVGQLPMVTRCPCRCALSGVFANASLSFRFPQRPRQQSPPWVALACPAVIGPFPHLAAGGIGERRRIGKKFHLVALAELPADPPVGDCDRFFEVASRRRDWLRDDTVVHFYNRHPAHALPTLCYTEWNDALDAAPIR